MSEDKFAEKFERRAWLPPIRKEFIMFKREFTSIVGKPSILGLGCMRLPLFNGEVKNIDQELGMKMVDYAISQGVNYFDTAYVYHEEMSESFIGKALKKYPRESFYLADKMPMWKMKTEEDVEEIFEEQLERCQVEYFDFYLCHAMNRQRLQVLKDCNVYEVLKRKKKEGKIRNLGFSFHDTIDVMEDILNTYQWDFGQIQLNYLDWEFQNAKRLYELLEEAKIPAIIMEPVRGGMLAELCEESEEILKAADKEASIASWAIRYAASFPNVLTVLSGMSNMEQVIDNTTTMKELKVITKEEEKIIDRALEAFKKASTIPCTACRYCMDCPSGVDIPKVFSVYNKYKIGKNKESFRSEYESIGTEHQAQNCISCGVCLEHCPQAIQIPERMEEVDILKKEIFI